MRPLLLVAGVISLAGCGGPRQGVLVMAHGGDAAWNRQIEAVVEPLRETYPVEVAFGMARTSTLRAAVQRLETQGVGRIAVVRMFVSGDSFLEPTEYILGLRDDLPGGGPRMEPLEQIPTQASFAVSRRGVAESPLVDDILADRVMAMSTDPARETVVILGHGPGDDAENERWLANMRARTRQLAEFRRFKGIHCETLREDWPQKRAEAERRIRRLVTEGGANGGRVIVVPFRIAGFGPYEHVLDGLDYVADGRGFCPHPNMTQWIDRTAQRCFAAR